MSTLQTRTRLNLHKPCDYRKNGYGCPNKRKSVARFCEFHWDNLANTGHLDGNLIHRSTYRPLQKRAAQYINSRQDHPLIVKALAYIRHEVILPGQMPTPPYTKPRSLSQHIEQAVYFELHRLQAPPPVLKGNGSVDGTAVVERPQPVTAEEVLAVCVGVWLAVQLQPRLLENDGDCLSFALANGLLGLRAYRQVFVNGSAQCRTPGTRARRALGEVLRPLSHTYQQIAEKMAPHIKETPEQALARKADDNRPLPAAEKNEQCVPLPLKPTTPAPVEPHVPHTLPARYPRPVFRSFRDKPEQERWERLNRLWTEQEARGQLAEPTKDSTLKVRRAERRTEWTSRMQRTDSEPS